MVAKPRRGEIWRVTLDPIRGHEQAGVRPALVVSEDPFNSGPSDLVVVLPMTHTDRAVLFHVAVEPQDSGLRDRGYIMCDQVRTIARERLIGRLGTVKPHVMQEVELRLALLLGL